jgi:signal transduction histidine kinase
VISNRMKWNNRSVIELSAIVATMAVVSVLAILQFRWTGEISRTEQQRLKSALATGVRNFTQEFSYDFQQLCASFEIDPEAPVSTLEPQLLRQYASWQRTTLHPGLVAGLQVWRTGDARGPFLESLDQSSERFQELAWPARLEPLRDFLNQLLRQLPSPLSDRTAVYYPWTFYEAAPALIRPLFRMTSSGQGAEPEVQPIGFEVVELNPEFLTKQYLPDLADRYFAGLGFAVTVRSTKPPYQTIYASDLEMPDAISAPDASVSLFDSVGEEAKRRGHPPLEPSDQARQWQLVVQHPAGSVEVAMAAWRRRNVAISFGLLAILAGGMGLIFTVARRAERLAKLQLQFVAGVSHELCTPLAVINSAAENLADGVVDDPQQMREYGGMIREQGHRLERMVDEVLLFAAGEFDRAGIELGPVEIARVVKQSLDFSEPMLRAAGFAVEKEISADLPLVVADAGAVGKCVENLVSNAVKYAGDKRWLAVRARVAAADPQPEVQISVEDKGIGIPATDLANIFEPFYRVQTVREGQIRGVGLGLYLVKRLMESMGGRVSVSSELGRGTFFILHFPITNSAEQ